MKKSFALLACAAGLIAGSSGVLQAQGTSARILMFHDVSFTDGKTAVSDDVYPDNFRDMMEFLERNYNVISMDQFIAWRQGAGSIPTNAVVITFDDNYEGTHDFARPIMGELGQVGINFAHTGFVGVVTSKDHADWDELRQQQAEGILSVESHTVTHPNLTTSPNPGNEITQSKAAIESQISGKTVRYLAYPFGGYNSSIISLTQSAGYTAAVTTIGGLNTNTTPFYELRRNGVGITVRLSEFKSIMGYSGSDAGGPVIIDNGGTGFTTTGTWSTIGTASANYGSYGNNFHRAARVATQNATARFTPTLAAGLHDVFVWYSSEVDPYQYPTAATYRVIHKGGTTTKTVNQRVSRASWHYLGRFDFNSGTGGYVELSNAATTGTYVSADAVKFQPVTSSAPTPIAPIIVDNGTSNYSETGTWTTSTSGDFWGTNQRVVAGGNGSATATATWSANIPRAGYYEVGVWYTTSNSSFRSNVVPYSVQSVEGLKTVTVNQQSSTTNGRRFLSLGSFRFNAGQQDVVFVSNAIPSTAQFVSADAVRIAWVANVGQPDVVVDNTDTGFTASANWTASTSPTGYLGSNYRLRNTASVSDAASWTATLPTSGSYTVYARWTAATGRATSAPFIVTHAGGNTTVNANQTTNNGTWVSLGSYNFNAGTGERVKLSCWTSSGTTVSADAIRLVKN